MKILNFTQAMSDQRPIHLGPFQTTEMAFFRQPVMSPLFYKNGQMPRAKDLTILLRWWKKPKYPSTYNSKNAYFNVVVDKAIPKSKVQEFERLGWKLVARTSYFNLFNKILKSKLPKNTNIRMESIKNKTALAEYLREMKKAFKFTRPMMTPIKKSIATLSEGQIVFVRNSKGKLMAAGAVFKSGRYAYCFGGYVVKSFQGRGLWKVLMSSRQSVSYEQGAREWCYVTSNDLLKKQGMLIFQTQHFVYTPEN